MEGEHQKSFGRIVENVDKSRPLADQLESEVERERSGERRSREVTVGNPEGGLRAAGFADFSTPLRGLSRSALE